MKLVFLPGMDGTGLLFDRLLAALPFPVEVIALPPEGEQSYLYLTEQLKHRLPTEDYVLLAESFSGPIAAQFARMQLPHLKGVIFLASFLIAPMPALLKLTRYVSPKWLLKLPWSHYFICALCIGWEYPVERFLQALNRVSNATLQARLETLAGLKQPRWVGKCHLPILLLIADDDFWVGKNQKDEFKRYFSDCRELHLPGKHFLAQSNPSGCAAQINLFLRELAGQ